MKLFAKVWIFLLVLTAVEVFLAYLHTPLTIMLVALIGLSSLKAAYIIAYFMHMKYERRLLRWLLFPAPIVFILALLAMLPDAAHGQCVMCQRTAAAQEASRQATLNKGIAIMAAPPVLGMAALFWRARRSTKPE
ncbi:MAG: cytochrome C oxidase subunit IV family protein [Bryobacterales bacterium]|nr:cytochrome C oxidase subunit IV family protein [Bryobacterales bacterium]